MLRVHVDNVGTVYAGDDRAEAERVFAEYVAQSRGHVGRAAGEMVYLFVGVELEKLDMGG
jgi:hypothetical protein